MEETVVRMRAATALSTLKIVSTVVFEAEASGMEVRQVVSPPFPFPFPSPPLFIPPKFSDKPVVGKVGSSEGEVPRLPPYKYHPA